MLKSYNLTLSPVKDSASRLAAYLHGELPSFAEWGWEWPFLPRAFANKMSTRPLVNSFSAVTKSSNFWLTLSCLLRPLYKSTEEPPIPRRIRFILPHSWSATTMYGPAGPGNNGFAFRFRLTILVYHFSRSHSRVFIDSRTWSLVFPVSPSPLPPPLTERMFICDICQIAYFSVRVHSKQRRTPLCWHGRFGVEIW